MKTNLFAHPILFISTRLFLLLALLLPAACQKTNNEDILCIVDGQTITSDEFVQRVETSPEIFMTESKTREEMLNILIDEAILAREAEKAGLDKSPQLERLVGFIKDMALSRALYQHKVRDAVHIDSSEINKAVQLCNETRRIAYLYLQDENIADSIQQRLTAGETFSTIFREFYNTETDTLSNLQEIRWGEQLVPIENAAFALQPGEVSPVITLHSGFLVLQLVDIVTQPITTQSEILQKQATVRKRLTARHEAQQSARYVHDFMNSEQVKFDEELARSVIDRIAERIMSEQNQQPLSQNRNLLSDSLFMQTEENLAPWLEETIVTFRNGKLTLRELLEKWRQTRLRVNQKSSAACKKSIAHNFSVLVRDALLAREARRLGYEKLPEVKNDCKIWRTHYLCELMTDDLKSKAMPVGDFIREKKHDYTITIDAKKLAAIQLTDIPVIALRPGQYQSRISPPWPDDFTGSTGNKSINFYSK